MSLKVDCHYDKGFCFFFLNSCISFGLDKHTIGVWPVWFYFCMCHNLEFFLFKWFLESKLLHKHCPLPPVQSLPIWRCLFIAWATGHCLLPILWQEWPRALLSPHSILWVWACLVLPMVPLVSMLPRQDRALVLPGPFASHYCSHYWTVSSYRRPQRGNLKTFPVQVEILL